MKSLTFTLRELIITFLLLGTVAFAFFHVPQDCSFNPSQYFHYLRTITLHYDADAITSEINLHKLTGEDLDFSCILHLACEKSVTSDKSTDFIICLIHHGANPMHFSGDGLTAVDVLITHNRSQSMFNNIFKVFISSVNKKTIEANLSKWHELAVMQDNKAARAEISKLRSSIVSEMK